MATEIKDIREEITQNKIDLGFYQIKPCSYDENQQLKELKNQGKPLPENINEYNSEYAGEFYTVHKPNLSEKEMQDYIAFKHLRLLKTIKNCVLFFTVLTIVNIIAAVWWIIIMFAR